MSLTSTIEPTVIRPDVGPKVDGSFSFSNDESTSGVVYGAAVRSTVAHARIRAVDPEPALQSTSVLAYFSAADVPGELLVGHIIADQPVFARDVVLHQGEPIGFVVATSQEEARRAAALVRVDYEQLPVLEDPASALANTAPILHPEGNLFRRVSLVHGGPIVPAEIEVEGLWQTGRQDQAFLGPESALAIPQGDGGVTLQLATQDLHADRRQIARALDLSLDLVRLELSGVGGAFGGREDITCQIHLCLAALRLERPVKTTYTRSESFLAHPKRHPAKMHYRVGADTDGTLRYVRARILLDGGPYASTSAPVTGVAAYFAAGPYRVPTVDIVAEAVRTNNPVSGAMRGFGAVQACFGIESTMDLLAEKIAMDPVDLRLRNALRPGDVFPTSRQTVGVSAPVVELIERCRELPNPDESPDIEHPYKLPGGAGCTTRGEDVVRGVGFALGVKHCLFGEGEPETCEATVTLSRSGVEVWSAAAEVGQGISGILAQVVSEELGELPVTVRTASSGAGYAGSSSASRQTWMSAGAVKEACRNLRSQLPAEIDLSERTTLESVGDRKFEAHAVYRAPETEAGDESGAGNVHVAWMFVAHRAIVDVDTGLGTVRIVQIATAQDVGRAMNRLEVEGQIRGGIAQGIGLALTEELCSEMGLVTNQGFTDYLLPTAADMPPVLIDLVETPEPSSPYGLKGVGEPPTLSSAPAIASAVRAATGAAVSRLPIRPEDLVLLT